MSQPTYLTSGDAIAVVGAGPAGSFFAIELLRRARALGIDLRADIYDGKNFARKGAPGCNMCAGAVGHNLIQEIERSTTTIPREVIHYEIEGYAVHYQDSSAHLENDPTKKIYGVYRGAGPVSTENPDGARSFDQFLLEQATKLGARHIPHNVHDIDVPATLERRPALRLADDTRIEYDLVIGAFGVNSQLAGRLLYGYVPPPTWKTCVIEARVSREFQREKLRNMIHFFVLKQPDIRYIALIPKGEHVTVTAIGEDVDVVATERLLRDTYMRDYLPPDWKLDCHCHPRVALGAARLPYSERFCIVGDASDSRYLKNGVESALVTARLAVDCVINHGVTARDFERHFWRRCNQVFGRDNIYGRMLFEIYDRIFPHPLLAPVYFAVLRSERKLQRPGALLSNALLAAFTGDQSYKRILLRALDPRLAVRMAGRAGGMALERTRAAVFQTERQPVRGLKLRDGSRVAIIGGGPGGASVAIRLLRNARARRINLRVTIYEPKQFPRHHNPCMGMLAPPTASLLRDRLNVEIPAEMIKRTIKGYRLHGDHNDIELRAPKYEEPALMVSRSDFDQMLLDRAVADGAHLLGDRVTGLEFHPDNLEHPVRVYSEGRSYSADMIVAACGLDDGMLSVLEKVSPRRARYHRPAEYMHSIIIKLKCDERYIEKRLNGEIHAFLLSDLPRIEFGAITPKQDHVLVNIMGHRVRSTDMEDFLLHRKVRTLLPRFNLQQLDFYEGHAPVRHARHVFWDRFIAVGDATGWLRPFKGMGITTAIQTGTAAADVMLERGIDGVALTAYARRLRVLTEDYYHGRVLRRLCRMGMSTGVIDGIIEQAKTNEDLYALLYHAISGHSYRRISRDLLSMATIWKMSTLTLKRVLRPTW
ncbi:MAG TPA: FAD/NAD(P)-binding protein [Pyrinomonadaceae bacterium]|jgi:flavin-dependent dehydrogenase|nr:FAD/NAD(P)-binding protein [Pyrinomonadaceae bacterium]